MEETTSHWVASWIDSTTGKTVHAMVLKDDDYVAHDDFNILMVSEQKGSSNTTIHVSIITQESTMDIKKKKEKRQIQEEKERRKAERADLVSEQKGSSNTTIHVSIITQESTMDIKKKKEKRQIQEEKERRKAERADCL
ncbi:hypothetical protein Tco_0586162 [Tanacetum coccineum]